MPDQNNQPVQTTAQKVDNYIDLWTQLKALETKVEVAATQLKAFGPSILKGTKGSVEVSEVAGRKSTKWDLVVAAAQVPASTVAQYTSYGDPSTRLTVKLPV